MTIILTCLVGVCWLSMMLDGDAWIMPTFGLLRLQMQAVCCWSAAVQAAVIMC